MSTIIHLPTKLPELSRQELLEELRAKENALLDVEQDVAAIAEAVWPEGSETEAPTDYRSTGQFEVSEVVAGVKSLHELVGRLLEENESLRQRLGALNVLLAYGPDNDNGEARSFAVVERALSELDATLVVTPADDEEVRWAVVAMRGEQEGVGRTLHEAFRELAKKLGKEAAR